MLKLGKQLFWDVKIDELDYIKHADFIIRRVLLHGDVEDYKIIKKKYGLKKVKNIAKKIDYPDRKSLNFWSLIFNIPLKSFQCIKKLSMKKQSAFSRR